MISMLYMTEIVNQKKMCFAELYLYEPNVVKTHKDVLWSSQKWSIVTPRTGLGMALHELYIPKLE